jgi:tetratricopeptide (TPR) repeat protein
MELQGVVGDKIIWRKKFPDPDYSGPVQNICVECKGKTISVEKYIHYRPLTERFSWNGTELKFLNEFEDDTEKKQIAEIFQTASQGTRPKQGDYEHIAEELSRTWDIIGVKDIEGLIDKTNQQAMIEFKANHLDRAIAREELGLGCAASFARGILWGSKVEADTVGNYVNDRGPRPLYWLESFRKLNEVSGQSGDAKSQLSRAKYIDAVNNYAYFLQVMGKNDKAISIFKRILTIDPDRTVAYLNLADSLWDSGSKTEAVDQYKLYVESAKKMKVKVIDQKAINRLKGLDK